jgi:hypothetical protein
VTGFVIVLESDPQEGALQITAVLPVLPTAAVNTCWPPD